MESITIPIQLIKAINEEQHPIRIYWLKWFSDYSEHLNRPDFVEYFFADMSEKGFKLNLETIKRAYEIGIPYLKDGFILNKAAKKQPSEDEKLLVVKVLNYLNECCNTSYTPSKANSECILARAKEGYTISDFMRVVDKKAAQWMNTEQQKYLRPITLFQAKKFENYLNEPENTIKDGKPKPKGNIGKLASATNKAKQFFT